MTVSKLSGGEAVVESLIAQGIETVFGLPGVQNDWLYNAFFDHADRIKVLHSRHEQGAAYMALGAHLATGKPSVFSVVPGPGFLNAAAALATAYGLNAEVLCLVGQIPRRAIGKDWGMLHEIPDQLGVMRSLTKWASRVNHPGEAPAKVAEAFRQMRSGRPQPVGLEVPMDVLEERGMVNLEVADYGLQHPPVDTEVLSLASDLLAKAENPMIIVGSGALNASQDVRALAEMLQAPVMAYRTGHGIMDARHYLSLHQPPAKKYWQKCDVVIAIGSNMRVPMQKWLRSHRPKIIRLDVDPLSHGRFIPPDIALTARAEDALPLLLEEIASLQQVRVSRREEMLELKAWWEKEVSVLEPQLTYLKVIREELDEDGIFVDELTQVGFASRIAYPTYHPRTYISTGYQGTLGYGFPTALGVKVAKPELPVISITGDGGFMFAVQELATAVQHNIPLITIVFNNNQYGNVQQMQKSLYDGRVIASNLHNPDFVRLAESFGAQGIRAETPDALRDAIRRGTFVDVPTLIEVPLDDVPSADRFR
ncbi:MAG: hypothetical protein KC422_02465 [Trueperaceae bacterium]|nr:hypothetical protein [Trueperaceae bacterium]